MRLLLLLILFAPGSGVWAESETFIFYYAWYGNPETDGHWLHWQDDDHFPPGDVSSAYYPKLGAYSSAEPAIIDQHMRWIAGANINVIIYSWWGRKDVTERNAKPILDAAAEYNLKVSFLIEPYEGRTTHRICDDIEYLNRSYGKHPAFFRLSRVTASDNNPAPRPLFFLYDPAFRDDDVRKMMQNIRASRGDSIVLLHSTDASLISRTGVDGIFAYEAVERIDDFYKGIVQTVRQMNGIFIPCVSPGFNMRRTLADRTALFRKRSRGRNYDRWWEAVIAADAEFVSVISFNEWHEGTQIEPAIRVRDERNSYASYDGAYNRRGKPAQESFLRRTARWIELYQELK